MTSPTLIGVRVTLRSAADSDAQARRRWGWHHDIERNYGHDCETRAMTADEAVTWLEEVRRRDSSTFWVIEVSGDVAGVAFLHTVSEVDQKARFAIGMFDPQFLGRGFGAEATRLVLAHAFDDLGLHRVDLRVLEFNTAAITSYRRAGFVEEGRERDSCRLEGRYYDDVCMGILAPEFHAL